MWRLLLIVHQQLQIGCKPANFSTRLVQSPQQPDPRSVSGHEVVKVQREWPTDPRALTREFSNGVALQSPSHINDGG